MKFKMRVVSYSPADLAREVGGRLAREQKTTNDGIPPSYPIQNERLLFIGVESKGSSFDQQVINFCKDLTPDRVHNVAFFNLKMRKNAPDINELVKIVEEDGINVIDDILEIDMNGSFFRKPKLKEKHINQVTEWGNKVIDSLMD